MAWVTIRKATEEDQEIVEDHARAFVKRHGLRFNEEWHHLYLDAVDSALAEDYGESAPERTGRLYLRRLWLRILRRALNSPGADGIAWGYVGYSCE